MNQQQAPAQLVVERPVSGGLLLLGREARAQFIALGNQFLNRGSAREGGRFDRLVVSQFHVLRVALMGAGVRACAIRS